MSAINSSSASASSFNLIAYAEKQNSEISLLERQAKNRMNELVGRTDISGSAGVKLNKDGSYEVQAQSKTDDAEKLKATVEKAFAEDEVLTGILEKLKTASSAAEEAKQAKAANNTQPTSQLRMLDKNGDTVEISEESRQLQEKLYEKNKHLFEDRSDRVILNYTARGDLIQLTGNHANKQDADSSFRRFTSYLLDDAFAAGEYENDFQIGIDAKNNLYVSGVTGKSGGDQSATADSEKARIESILSKLNSAVTSNPTENESETIQTLRKFFNDSARYDSQSLAEPYAKTKFPFTLQTSVKLW